MEYLKLGVYAGLLLAIATAAGGLPGVLMGLVFAGIGGVLGAHRDGRIDLRAMLGSAGRGRR